jgi:hypothetical protein
VFALSEHDVLVPTLTEVFPVSQAVAQEADELHEDDEATVFTDGAGGADRISIVNIGGMNPHGFVLMFQWRSCLTCARGAVCRRIRSPP